MQVGPGGAPTALCDDLFGKSDPILLAALSRDTNQKTVIGEDPKPRKRIVVLQTWEPRPRSKEVGAAAWGSRRGIPTAQNLKKTAAGDVGALCWEPRNATVRLEPYDGAGLREREQTVRGRNPMKTTRLGLPEMPALTTCRNEYCRSCSTAKLRMESRTEHRRWCEWGRSWLGYQSDWLRPSVPGDQNASHSVPTATVEGRFEGRPPAAGNTATRRESGVDLVPCRCPRKPCAGRSLRPLFSTTNVVFALSDQDVFQSKGAAWKPLHCRQIHLTRNFSHALCTSDCMHTHCLAQNEPRLKSVSVRVSFHLQCRQRRGLKPLNSRRMMSIAPWRYTILSHVMSPSSSTTSTTERLLQ